MASGGSVQTGGQSVATEPSAGGSSNGQGGATQRGGNGSGGAVPTGGTRTTVGGTHASSGGASTGGTSMQSYTLVVDTPKPGATLIGVVQVSGWAPGFVNVEAWDGTHQKPPLGQTSPTANGAFAFSVDVTSLTAGATQWTIWAWDTPAGVTPTHSTSVPLNLTISGSPQGTGGTSHAGGSSSSGGARATGGSSSSGGSTGSSNTETLGSGNISTPAVGPAPSEATKVGGAAFTLVKNWNFGTSGTIRSIGELSSEFMYHDHWGTIGNGSNYGAVTVAPNSATAISGQPVEDSARPYREFTADTMKAYVMPLSTTQSTVSVSSHNAGNGSITAKWTLGNGGALLGKDLLWETRARMPVAAAAYWFAIWTAGNKWDKGAEMDVLESFGTPNIYPPPAAFHVNSVGGDDTINYSSWPTGLNAAGVPSNARDLREWHTWTWLYRKDDSYVVYFDGYVVQSGNIHWTLSGVSGGEQIDMSFLFDFGWGHTQIADVNISLPASNFNITYEIDYSRVYLR